MGPAHELVCCRYPFGGNIGSLAGIAFMSCSSSLCEIGAGAKGFGGCLTLALDEGLDPVVVRGGGRDGGAVSFAGASNPPSLAKKLSCWCPATDGLTGEVPWIAESAMRSSLEFSLEFVRLHSSKGVPASSSMFVLGQPSSSKSSSREALMKPESGCIGNGGRAGLDRLGNPLSMTGGEDGMLNCGSKIPWYRASSGDVAGCSVEGRSSPVAYGDVYDVLLWLEDSRRRLGPGRARRGISPVERVIGVGGRTGSSLEFWVVDEVVGVGRWMRTEAAVLAATRNEPGCLSMFRSSFVVQSALKTFALLRGCCSIDSSPLPYPDCIEPRRATATGGR